MIYKYQQSYFKIRYKSLKPYKVPQNFIRQLRTGISGVHFVCFEPVFNGISKVVQIEWFGDECIGTIAAQ